MFLFQGTSVSFLFPWPNGPSPVFLGRFFVCRGPAHARISAAQGQLHQLRGAARSEPSGRRRGLGRSLGVNRREKQWSMDVVSFRSPLSGNLYWLVGIGNWGLEPLVLEGKSVRSLLEKQWAASFSLSGWGCRFHGERFRRR